MSGLSINIGISAQAREILVNLGRFPDWMAKALARALDKQNILTVSRIQSEYLSFPKADPSVTIGLRYQTGRYRDSLRASPTVISGMDLQSSIGTNVVSDSGVSYPAVHEFGAEIPARPPRPTKSNPNKMTIGRRAFSLPARMPIQRGIADREDKYTEALSAAAIKACQDNI